jgi:hypothetical protein
MPDLDIVPSWTCNTNIHWSHEVESHRGGTKYTVRFEHRPWPHTVQYDYTCTCPSFRFGNSNTWSKEKACKHIEQVMEHRCGWNGELEPTAEVDRDEDDQPCCPECAGPVTAMGVGV